MKGKYEDLIKPVEEAIEKILDAISKGKRRIIVYGEPGSGRSKVIDILEKELELEGKKVISVLASLEGMKKAFEKLDEVDVILVDDADLVFDTEYEIDELTLRELVERANEKGKTIVLSCVIDYKDRLARFVHPDEEIKIGKPNFEQLKELLLKKIPEEDRKLLTEKDLIDIYKWSGGNLNLAIIIADFIVSGRKKYLKKKESK